MTRDTAGGRVPPVLASARRRLLDAKQEWAVGSFDGPPHTQWAYIADVTTDEAGRVYVLDRFLSLVRVLTPDGAFITDVLREGDGPLEVRDPIGVGYLGGDTLMVFGALQIRVLSGWPDAIQYERQLLRERSVYDVCTTGTALAIRVASHALAGTVQLTTIGGDDLVLFGDLHPDGEDMRARAERSGGFIACGPDGTIVTAFEEAPYLYGYDARGERLWASAVEGFATGELRTVSVNGMPGFTRPGDQPSDRVLTLNALPGGMGLMQVARLEPQELVRGRSIRRISRFDTYVFDTSSGGGLYVGPGLPRILHATQRQFFAMQSDSASGPRLTAWAW